jgi:hypothetical protein
VTDSIDLMHQRQPIALQTMLCTNDLQDVANVISGAKISPPQQYLTVKAQVPKLQTELQNAAARSSSMQLSLVLNQLVGLRHSIATVSPDLP